MRKTWSWCAVRLVVGSLATVLATVPPAHAATVLSRNVSIEIGPAGTVERTSLRVRLESEEDLSSWAVYPIYLDDNRSLETVSAFTVRPDGSKDKVRRKDRDTIDYSGTHTHSSTRFHLLEFSGLEVGSELDIGYAVEVEPYYPSGHVPLAGDDAVERLEVAVRGGGDAWRWRIDGPAEGFTVEEAEGGVVVTARDLPAVDPPELAPGGAAVYPVLRYAWGREGSWRDFGAWYSELLRPLPRAADPVRAQARELIAGLEDPRQRLEALLGFLRRKVRYVAVEVGVGGFQPSPPEDVLTRRWGDCKDKSLLLIDFLHEAGIDAYPALILAAADRRVDVEFPAPQFNHLIVAVPSSALDFGEDDPVNDGYLFVDPTQERGSGTWLQPADQDQDVLVVRDGTGTLARTPIRPALESSRLVVQLRVLDEGEAVGGAALALSGDWASGFIEQMASAPPERTEEDARRIFSALLPGVVLKGVGWNQDDADVPEIDMSAPVRIEGLVEGLGSRPSFKLASLKATPEPRRLGERDVPLVLRPQKAEASWRLVLPEGWCLPEEKTQRVENAVGLFEQSVTLEPEANRVTVERKVEIRRRWLEPEEVPALRELALAEHRAHRRRIRLACE